MRTRILLLLSCFSSLVGCAANSPRPAPHVWTAPITSPTFTITDTRTGSEITLAQLVDAAAVTDAVLIGELHGQPDGQAFEATFFRALLERAPTSLAALEFLERDEQVHLDDFVSGITDEPAFTKATGRTPGNYTPGHRDIILASAAAKRPVIAANAPRRYVRVARADGYDRLGALSLEQSRQFAIPDPMPTGAYEQRFIDLMAPVDEKGKRPREEDARKMFRSQAMWDATMADSVAQALAARKGRPIVLVIGVFHIAHNGGTLQLLREHAPSASVLTIAMQAKEGQTEISAADGPIADYVVTIPNEESPDFTASR